MSGTRVHKSSERSIRKGIGSEGYKQRVRVIKSGGVESTFEAGTAEVNAILSPC
jgi:hypothetical protein